MWRKQLEKFCAITCLVLVACLPFLVPFNPASNVDLQAWLLIVAGSFGWIAILASPRAVLDRNHRLLLVPLLFFAMAALVSALVNPHVGWGLLGPPWLRLGALGYLACIGCGLVAQTVPLRQLMWGLYVGILSLGIISIPYSLWLFKSLNRLPGLFAQADLMAIFLGVGLVLGLQLIKSHPERRLYLWLSQALLATLLLLTQTRAVILGTVLIVVVWQVWHRAWSWRQWLMGLAVGAMVLTGASLMGAKRLTSHHDFIFSVHYLADLQGHSLKLVGTKPWLGYGPGNLADALDCRSLTAPDLLDSCREGFFFNSSHNIYLDRLLGAGLPGGLAYLVFVAGALVFGLRKPGAQRVLAAAALLIAVYYFTNITAATLEVLFFILLLRATSRA